MFQINTQRFTRGLFFCLFLLSVAITQTGVAFAQGLSTPGQDAPAAEIAMDELQSKEAVREMVSKLSDDSVRNLLIERLDAVAEANEQSSLVDVGALSVLRERFASYLAFAKRSISDVDLIPSIVAKIMVVVKSSIPQGFSYFFLVVLLAIVAGVCAERLIARFFRKSKQELIEAFSTTLWGILKILYTRLSYDLMGVLAFFTASYVVIASFFGQDSLTNQIAYIAIATVAATWLAYVVCRFFFAPKRPELRICKTTDQRATQLTVSYSVLAGFIVLVHNSFYLFVRIGFENYGGFEYMSALAFWLNGSMYLSAAWVIWYNRRGLTEILTENKKRVSLAIGEEASEDLSWFAIHWPRIAIFLIVCKYFLVELIVNSSDVAIYSTSAVYITFVVILLWPGVDANVSLFVSKGIKAPEDETLAAGKARRSTQQGLLRVGRVLVVGVVLYALAWLWGLNLLDLAEAGFGAQAAGTLVEFLFIVLFAYISWELVSVFVGQWLAKEGGQPDEEGEEAGGEIGGVGLSRVATVLPIIRKTALFLIVVVSVIMVLDNWGVNVGPILAGAGVIGLAIGFGAQTLVKDIVSGLFFLADDAFRVGEYVDVGGTMGNVEKISLRSLRLRHHRGLVHTVPYGEIPKLTNFSRDWVIMKLRFRVPFDTDVNRVKKLFKKIGADLLEDPVLGDDFLQPFKSQGVAEVDDNGIVVRGKFMAKPGKQFMIRKEVYVRVQKAFDEAGIPFARKQVMVHIPGLDKGEELDKDVIKSIGAAATEATEEIIEPVR